jgi:NAD(P)-dependent dehydrogenase (short-subunit alcohol dehydrogenase family)
MQLEPKGIRVNAVAPGFAYTPFLAASGYSTEEMLDVIETFPQPRMEQPVELAVVYVNLAEGINSYATGDVWGASGGLGGF